MLFRLSPRALLSIEVRCVSSPRPSPAQVTKLLGPREQRLPLSSGLDPKQRETLELKGRTLKSLSASRLIGLYGRAAECLSVGHCECGGSGGGDSTGRCRPLSGAASREPPTMTESPSTSAARSTPSCGDDDATTPSWHVLLAGRFLDTQRLHLVPEYR